MIALGLDVGTTGVKAVAVQEDGRVLGAARQEYRLLAPQPGWVELEPTSVWRAARSVVARATASLPEPPAAVGLSAPGEAFVPVDRHSHPLGAAIVSFDQRAAADHRAAMETIGADRFESATGTRPLPHHAVFKWLWWRRQRPDVFERTQSFVGLGSWVAARLGGAPAIDPSLAVRTAIWDPSRQRWDASLVEALSLPAGKLPEVPPSDAACGVVSRAAGAGIGLAAGAPIVAGGLDQACAAYELGIDGPVAMLTLGTTAVVSLSRRSRDDIASWIPSVPHVEPGRWLAMAGSPAGASVLRWFRDVVLLGDGRRASKRDSYDAVISRAADHRASVLFLPHLGGSRVAFDDPDARGAFLGLTHAAREVDLTRAVLDGVAYEVVLLLERLDASGLPVGALRANGGGSRSQAWMQLIADATDRPLESVGGSDSPALGAARLASRHLGRAVEPPRQPPLFRVAPRPSWSAYHDERLRQFRVTYEALRAIRDEQGGTP